MRYCTMHWRTQNFSLRGMNQNMQLGFWNKDKIFIRILGENIGFLCEFSKLSQNFHYGFRIRPRTNMCKRPHIDALGSTPGTKQYLTSIGYCTSFPLSLTIWVLLLYEQLKGNLLNFNRWGENVRSYDNRLVKIPIWNYCCYQLKEIF